MESNEMRKSEASLKSLLPSVLNRLTGIRPAINKWVYTAMSWVTAPASTLTGEVKITAQSISYRDRNPSTSTGVAQIERARQKRGARSRTSGRPGATDACGPMLPGNIL